MSVNYASLLRTNHHEKLHTAGLSLGLGYAKHFHQPTNVVDKRSVYFLRADNAHIYYIDRSFTFPMGKKKVECKVKWPIFKVDKIDQLNDSERHVLETRVKRIAEKSPITIDELFRKNDVFLCLYLKEEQTLNPPTEVVASRVQSKDPNPYINFYIVNSADSHGINSLTYDLCYTYYQELSGKIQKLESQTKLSDIDKLVLSVNKLATSAFNITKNHMVPPPTINNTTTDNNNSHEPTQQQQQQQENFVPTASPIASDMISIPSTQTFSRKDLIGILRGATELGALPPPPKDSTVVMYIPKTLPFMQPQDEQSVQLAQAYENWTPQVQNESHNAPESANTKLSVETAPPPVPRVQVIPAGL